MRRMCIGAAVVLAVALSEVAFAQIGGQFFVRGGVSKLTEGSRGGDIFADTRGLAGQNDDDTGFSLGFGLDLPLMKDPWLCNTILGEIIVDYAEFSDKRVLQTAGALIDETNITDVSVAELAVAAAFKYRVEMGRLRPWIIPIGVAVIVNSPPTDDTTVLDVGLPFGIGVDYLLTEKISVGLDCRYYVNFDLNNISSGDYLTAGGYLGVNF